MHVLNTYVVKDDGDVVANNVPKVALSMCRTSAISQCSGSDPSSFCPMTQSVSDR